MPINNRRSATEPPKQVGGEKPRSGLTMKRLLMNTMGSEFKTRFENAVRDRVRVASFGRTKVDMWKTTTTETKNFTESEEHTQLVRKIETGKSFSVSRLACRCDCSDFKYRFEYALARKGAALEPRAATNQPPLTTNPAMTPAVCKHMIVVFKRLLDSGQ